MHTKAPGQQQDGQQKPSNSRGGHLQIDALDSL